MATEYTDLRVHVLLIIAGLICLVHLVQQDWQRKQSSPVKHTYIWLSGIEEKGLYLLSDFEITYSQLYKAGGLVPPVALSSKIFLPQYYQSYHLVKRMPPRQSLMNYRVAPLFFAPIPINMADREILTIVPGIGSNLAAKIIAHREKIKSFKFIEELTQVEGVGEKKMKKLKHYFYVQTSSKF